MKDLSLAIMVYTLKAVGAFAVFYTGLRCGLWAATAIDKKELIYDIISMAILFVISYVFAKLLPRLEREGFFDVKTYEEAEEVIIPIEEEQI